MPDPELEMDIEPEPPVEEPDHEPKQPIQLDPAVAEVLVSIYQFLIYCLGKEESSRWMGKKSWRRTKIKRRRTT